MTKFKKGDRVRVCWMSDYDMMVSKHLNIPTPIGRTGIVVETQYNPNMAVYGQGNEVLVHMDGDAENVTSLWTEQNLEIIS